MERNEYGVHSDWFIENGSEPEQKIYKYLHNNKEKYNWLDVEFIEDMKTIINNGYIVDRQFGNARTYLTNILLDIIAQACEDYCIENKIVKSKREYNKITKEKMSEYWFLNYGLDRLRASLKTDVLRHQGWLPFEFDSELPRNCIVKTSPVGLTNRIYKAI